MGNPQQPEIRRSTRHEAVQDSVKSRQGGPDDESGNTGPIPEANEPGYHPDMDQDQPTEVPDAYKAPE